MGLWSYHWGRIAACPDGWLVRILYIKGISAQYLFIICNNKLAIFPQGHAVWLTIVLDASSHVLFWINLQNLAMRDVGYVKISFGIGGRSFNEDVLVSSGKATSPFAFFFTSTIIWYFDIYLGLDDWRYWIKIHAVKCLLSGIDEGLSRFERAISSRPTTTDTGVDCSSGLFVTRSELSAILSRHGTGLSTLNGYEAVHLGSSPTAKILRIVSASGFSRPHSTPCFVSTGTPQLFPHTFDVPSTRRPDAVSALDFRYIFFIP